MSYILDALRKADAERERDPSRGIHAQPASPADAGTARPMRAWGWGAAALCAAALVAYVAWPEAPQALPDAPVAVAPEPAPPPPEIVAVATSVRPPPPAPAPMPMPVAARPAGEPNASWKKAPEDSAKVPAPAAAVPPERILAVSDLPADVQRELPKLAISGGVHSQNAAQRLLIVGGQVVKEGAELAPGVVLEQIRSRNAVLRYRDYRYSVSF